MSNKNDTQCKPAFCRTLVENPQTSTDYKELLLSGLGNIFAPISGGGDARLSLLKPWRTASKP